MSKKLQNNKEKLEKYLANLGFASRRNINEFLKTKKITLNNKKAKKDIQERFEDKVLKISGVSFDWKPLTEKEKETIHGNQGQDVGVITQEVEEVLPEVVTTRDSGYKAVKYEKIVPLLIESIKELKQEIEELKKQ